MHGAHAVVGTEEGAEEAASEVEAHGVGFDGEMRRLAGEVAEDDQYGAFGRDVFWLADHDEDILVVAVDGEEFAGVDGAVAVMEIDELAVPVEERCGVGVLECCIGGWGGRSCFGRGRGLSLGGWRRCVPNDDWACGCGV